MTEGERFWSDAGNSLITNFPLTKDSVVFDIGGYLGDWTQFVQKKYDCWVYVYEPVEKFCQQIRNRFSDNYKVKVYPYGLEDDTRRIQIATMDDGSSAHMPHREDEPFVWFHDIAEELKNIGLPNLLTINAEGSEYPILERLIQINELKNIDHLLVQFHDFAPNAVKRREWIRERFNLTHRENFCYPFVWESWSRI